MSKFDKIEELQGLIKEDSTNYRARRQLAVLLLDCGFNEEALQHLLYLSKMYTNDEGIFYNLGIVYEKLKNFHKAKEAYEKALEIDPESIDAIYNLGLVYTELKEYQKAIMCFEMVIESDKEDSNSYFNLGLVYFKMENFLRAVEYFQKTIDLNDDDIYAHFYIGNIMKEFGDLEAAREKFKKVLSISPDYSWAYYNIAVIDYDEGNIQEAIYNLKQTIELNPLDIEAYKNLIKILSSDNNNQQAYDYAQKAINNCGESGDLFYIMAGLSKKLKKTEEYKTYLNEAIRNFQTLSVPVQKVKNELKNIGIKES